MQHYTTIEESKKLVELGLNPDTADMQWFLEDDYGIVQIKDDLSDWGGDCVIPCWSLGALLEVLKTRKDCNFITIHSSDSLKWSLNTSYYELANWKEKETLKDTLIEAAYSMVVWLLENGYIEKGE